MIIVIDGYNVLKQITPRLEIDEQQRTHFVKVLARYAAIKGHKLVIVFDGGLTRWPQQEVINHVEVVYVGIRMSADDYISDYLTRNVGLDLLLVSTDRVLNRSADALRVPSIDSHDFYNIVQQTFNRTSNRYDESPLIIRNRSKEYGNDQSTIDELMMQAAAQVTPKKVDLVVHELDSMQRIRTIEKKLCKILKKL